MIAIAPLKIDEQKGNTADRIEWSESRNTYVYKKSKKVVPDKTLYKAVAERIEKNETKFYSLSENLVNKKISFEDWQRDMSSLISEEHADMFAFGKGGPVTNEDMFAVQEQLTTVQYPALHGFSADIQQGKLSEAQILSRSKLYGRSTRVSFESGRKHSQPFDTKARRKLSGSCDHCQPCVRYAGLGWVPLEQLILPTEKCDCRANCCCSVEYSRKPAQELQEEATQMFEEELSGEFGALFQELAQIAKEEEEKRAGVAKKAQRKIEAKRRAEAKRKAEAKKKKAQEEERKRKVEAEEKRKAEEETKRKKEVAAAKRKATLAKKKAEAEALKRIAEEEEAKRKAEAKRKEEEEKRKAEEEEKRKAEEAKKKAEEEAKRKKKEAAAAKRKATIAKKKAEAEEKRKREETEAKKKAEEEAKRKKAEEDRKAEAEKELKRKAEEAKKKKVEEKEKGEEITGKPYPGYDPKVHTIASTIVSEDERKRTNKGLRSEFDSKKSPPEIDEEYEEYKEERYDRYKKAFSERMEKLEDLLGAKTQEALAIQAFYDTENPVPLANQQAKGIRDQGAYEDAHYNAEIRRLDKALEKFPSVEAGSTVYGYEKAAGTLPDHTQLKKGQIVQQAGFTDAALTDFEYSQAVYKAYSIKAAPNSRIKDISGIGSAPQLGVLSERGLKLRFLGAEERERRTPIGTIASPTIVYHFEEVSEEETPKAEKKVEEKKRKAEEAKRKESEAKKKAEEEKKRKAEEEAKKKKAEEEKRKAEEKERKKKEAAAKRKATLAKKKKAEEEERAKKIKKIKPIDKLSKDELIDIGKNYLDKFIPKAGPTKEALAAVTKDLAERGKKAFEEKGYDLLDFYEFSTEENEKLSKKEQKQVVKTMEKYLHLIGGYEPSVTTFKKTGDRAYQAQAGLFGFEINIGTYTDDNGNTPEWVLMHEMSHSFEKSLIKRKDLFAEPNRIGAKISEKFILDKATGPEEKLSKLTGSNYYDDSETAYPDKFYHEYVGKMHVSSVTDEVLSTEVFSMGIQDFYNPKAFVQEYDGGTDHIRLMTGIILSNHDNTWEQTP